MGCVDLRMLTLFQKLTGKSDISKAAWLATIASLFSMTIPLVTADAVHRNGYLIPSRRKLV